MGDLHHEDRICHIWSFHPWNVWLWQSEGGYTKPIIDAYMYFTAGDLLYTSHSLSSLTEANNELHITVFRSIAT